ncbi:proteasome regulatory particle base subunit [Coemansia asiatica]|uniref:Ribophorin II n=1 Tax=Coemansia asiatica TaxID=1052880 RepID=A0A9W8CL45_9FUNG|nr:proteasome regulatory particle base subunit [Coemansia asiatica]
MKPFSLVKIAAALCVLASTCIAAISTSNVVVKVMERTGDKLFEKKLAYPKTFDNGPTITAATPFSVSFDASSDRTGKALALDQAFVSLRNMETGDEMAFAAKMGKNGSYRMDVTRKQFRSHLGAMPGKHMVSLVLGSFDEGGLFYELGEVQVAGKKRIGNADVLYGPRDEIHHRFAEPQRMPNVLLSLVFAGLVAAPLLALVGVWVRMGVNMSNLAKEPVGSSALMVLVAAYMALAVAYWIGVRLLPMLAYVLALALPTYLVGQYALSRRIQLGL